MDTHSSWSHSSNRAPQELSWSVARPAPWHLQAIWLQQDSESLCFLHLFLSSLPAQELQKYEQYIFADYTSVIQVENVYEEILYQTLLEEALKGENIFEVTGITLQPVPSELPRVLTWLFLPHFLQHWWLCSYSVFSFTSLKMYCKP